MLGALSFAPSLRDLASGKSDAFSRYRAGAGNTLFLRTPRTLRAHLSHCRPSLT